MTDENELREAFVQVARELPEPWELAGVTYHGPEAGPPWVAFLLNTETGDAGGPEGWGSSPLAALEDLRTKFKMRTYPPRTHPEARRVALRTTFDEAAELYDRARPRYPRELVDDLASLAGLREGSRVLEIGIGTGQLTRALAERGLSIVGVEMGAGLAAVAARNLAAFPRVSVVNAAFEEWPLPAEPFDLMVAASSFHWIDPDVRVTKGADALRIGGSLATIGTVHVAGGDVAFFADTASCYDRWDPGGSTSSPGNASPADLPKADEIGFDTEDLDSTGRFGPITFRTYPWDKTYTAPEYLDALQTYSGHRALPEEQRAGLLECIRELIDTRYGGSITKRYLFPLRIAARRA